jgi:hypothetical protein
MAETDPKPSSVWRMGWKDPRVNYLTGAYIFLTMAVAMYVNAYWNRLAVPKLEWPDFVAVGTVFLLLGAYCVLRLARPRRRRTNGAVSPALVLLLVLVVLFAGSGVTRAAATVQGGGGGSSDGGEMIAPFALPISALGSSTEGCSTVQDEAGPSANVTTGAARVEVGSISYACGVSKIWAEAGFISQVFNVTQTGTFELTGIWSFNGGAELGDSIPFLGATSLDTSFVLDMFLSDDTLGGEYPIGGLSTSIFAQSAGDGVEWTYITEGTLWATVNGTAELTAGQGYEFFAYLIVTCQTGAIGIAVATCNTNWAADLEGLTYFLL